MVCKDGRKLLGVRNPAKKWQQRKKKGIVKSVLEGFKTLAKTLTGAKHNLLHLAAEWLEIKTVCKTLTLKTSKTEEEKEMEEMEVSRVLPPLRRMQMKTIVLDLDETLIHSSEEPLKVYDFTVDVMIRGEPVTYYVLKRPGVDELLSELGRKHEIVLFTAAIREYAEAVVERIDRHGFISHRLYRDSCVEMEGRLVKDLAQLGRDLRRVIIVDDNPNAYMLQPQNAIPVSSFVDDLYDRELRSVVSFFRVVEGYEDLRVAIRHFVFRDHLPWEHQ